MNRASLSVEAKTKAKVFVMYEKTNRVKEIDDNPQKTNKEIQFK